MRIRCQLLNCDFQEDILTLQLPKGFWSKKHHVIREGDLIIETDGMLPPRNKPCNACLSDLTH